MLEFAAGFVAGVLVTLLALAVRIAIEVLW